MCCFSRAVRFVGGTRIFARGLPDGRQWLAYSMNVEIDQDLAMVLPLPVPPGSPEDAVQFLDLSGYPKFFEELSSAFPPVYALQGAKGGLFRGGAPPVQKLVVHDVGMFEASFVPTRADFARLDERFRLPESTFDAMPRYADYGFAVFRLKPKKGLFGGVKRQTIHPMAFSFPRREPRSLFFPTVHVHDGTAPEQAVFDHELFCQADGVLAACLAWTRSHDVLGKTLDVARAGGLFDGAEHGFVHPLFGPLPNDDTWLREPAGVRVEELRGAGESYSFEVFAHWSQYGAHDERSRAWRDTALHRLGPLARGLGAGLAELCAQKREAWSLGPLTRDLPPHFINGSQLWSGEDWMTGKHEVGTGKGRVHFKPFTDRVEPQSIHLGFTRMPDQARADEIQAELRRLLDRAVA